MSLLIALMSATGAVAVTAVAQKAAPPDPQDKLALADENVKELLLLMDADPTGAGVQGLAQNPGAISQAISQYQARRFAPRSLTWK